MRLIEAFTRFWNTYRSSTHDHARPGFIIAGAQKAGTTFLFNLLSRHPNLRPACEKEVRFFNQDVSFNRGVDWYHRFFPRLDAMRPGDLAFEASPNYLFSEAAAERMAVYDPGLRLIVTLRDPVDRAYSAWNMYRQAQARPVLPLFPVSRFDERVRREVDGLLQAPSYPSFEESIRRDLESGRVETIETDIVRVGFYDEQLARFFRVFDRNRILILTREEVLRDRISVAGRITDFLGLPPHEWPEDALPRSGVADYEEAIPRVSRARLEAIYRPHNDRLYEMLGRNLGWPA